MLDLATIQKAMQLKGHKVFENDSKPYNLNYVGIRDTRNVGSWNDWFVMFWKYHGQWSYLVNMGTTDPGLHYMKHLLNTKGVAILKEDQHSGAWTCGYHRQSQLGQTHPGLVQYKEVTVIRDANRDNVLDMGGVEDHGWHGINHHGALKEVEVPKVGKFSAGCQVRLQWDEHQIAYEVWREAEESWGKGITYTILNINDLK